MVIDITTWTPSVFKSLEDNINSLLPEGYDWKTQEFPLSIDDIDSLLQQELEHYFPKQIVRDLVCEIIINMDTLSVLCEINGSYFFNTKSLEHRGDWTGDSEDAKSLARIMGMLDNEISRRLENNIDKKIQETFTFNLKMK